MALEEIVLLAVGLLILWHVARTGGAGEQAIEKKQEEIPYRTPSL